MPELAAGGSWAFFDRPHPLQMAEIGVPFGRLAVNLGDSWRGFETV